MAERDEDSLSDAFWAVARQLRGLSRDTLAPLDVTPSQSRALRSLARHGQLRLGDLAEHLRIAPRSATEVVDDLESAGLAHRRPDPADRRATLVVLTPAGEERIAAIKAARRDGEERVFGRLSDSDRRALARILGRLRD